MPVVDTNKDDYNTLVWDVGEQKECYTWTTAAITLSDGKTTPALLCGSTLSSIFVWSCWHKYDFEKYDKVREEDLPPKPCQRLLAEQSRLFSVRLSKGSIKSDDLASYLFAKENPETIVTHWQCTKRQDGSIDCQ